MISEPIIVEMDEKRVLGMRIRTSLMENRTVELWKSFKPKVKEMAGQGTKYYSVRKFDDGFDMDRFTPETVFVEWAAAGADARDPMPDGLESLVLPGGSYAVFTYQGAASGFYPVAQYIYATWLPASGYTLADREHFTVMGEKYSPDDPASVEEIWIPVDSKRE
jgi:AraC family transcriptional regulator